MKLKSVARLIKCYDNDGKTFDRYTVLYLCTRSDYPTYGQYTYDCLCMSEHPTHPQGFGQHVEAKNGKHLGTKIKFENLPVDCQNLVLSDLKEFDKETK